MCVNLKSEKKMTFGDRIKHLYIATCRFKNMASIFFFTDVNYSRLDFATLYHKNIIQYVKFLEIILTVQKLRLNLLLSFFFCSRNQGNEDI